MHPATTIANTRPSPDSVRDSITSMGSLREGKGGTPAAISADPLLSANVYAAGLLDDLLRRGLMPFWQNLQPAQSAHLWVVRDTRRGEHLKIRLHADPAYRESLKASLQQHLQAYIDRVQELSGPTTRLSRFDIPAIDLDDEGEDELPDRSLRWTRYRRSYVNLGGEPFLSRDPYAAAMCRCLARGLELVLVSLSQQQDSARQQGTQPDSPWNPSLQWRQQRLLGLLVSGLGAAGLGRSIEAIPYLRHHRDVLLRHATEELQREKQLLELFARSAERVPSPALQQLRNGLQKTADNRSARPLLRRWQLAVAELVAYVDAFRQQPEYVGHPLAAQVRWTPLFKAMHGMANQVGLEPLQEAYIHHLLLTALDSPDLSATGGAS